MDDVNCKNPYLEGGGGEFLKTTQDSCTYRAKFYLVYWSTAVVVFHCIGWLLYIVVFHCIGRQL